MMKGTLKLLVFIFLVAGLYACGGGGGGGGTTPTDPPVIPPVISLIGTVTDTTLAPVAGATVVILETGTTATTDAAGRYSFDTLVSATEYTLKFSGPDPSYFPSFAESTLVGDSPTVLDVYLIKAEMVPPVDAGALVDVVVDSTTFFGGVERASLTLSPNALEDAGGVPYNGMADVYLAPIDVGKLGFGLASYQAGLDIIAAVTASDTIVELYGAAAVRIDDATGSELSLIAPGALTLEIPIPASPVELRENALLNPEATLWYLDETNGTWVEDGTASVDDLISPTSYIATISRPGIWRVGVINGSVDLSEITGQVTYDDSSPATGATIYVSGVDYAYQDQTTTNFNGNFTFLAKTVGTVAIHSVVAANGAQWTHAENFTNPTNPTAVNISLPFAPPVLGAASKQTVNVESRDSVDWQGPDVMGYILSSGRQVYDLVPDSDLTARNAGNITFVAHSLAGVPPITLEPSLDGSGILVVTTGETFGSLTSAPASGYDDTPAAAIDLSTATLPLLVAVRTAQNHFAKISIEEVTDVSAINGAEEKWQITFSHAFSLTNTF